MADAQKAWGLSPNAASARLARYERRGWVRRARRGLYLILPLEADPRNPATVEDPWLLANELFAPCYVGGWSAAEHWGLTEQIFRSVFVVSAANLRAAKTHVMGVDFRIAHVAPARIRHAESIWRGSQKVLVSGREGTIADGLAAPAWLGGVRHLADVLRAYHDSAVWKPEALLLAMQDRWSGAAFKRLGWLTERLFPGEHRTIEECLRRRTSGVVALDPAVKGRGHIHKRWGLRINVDVEPTGSHG